MNTNETSGSKATPTQPCATHGTQATSPAPRTGAENEDEPREWDEWDDPEEDEDDDINYSGLDPAFSSWEDVNRMFI